MIRLWTVVFAANLLGAFIFALVVSHTDIFNAEIKQMFGKIGSKALRGESLTIFLKAIFAAG